MRENGRMPGSIRRKLILTYSAVIAVFLITTVVLLNITARQYLEESLEKNLLAEASVIEELYRERTDQLTAGQSRLSPEDFRLLVREWFSDVRKISKLGFSSNIALVLKPGSGKYSIFTPGESRNEENFRKVNPTQMVERLGDEPLFFQIQAGETTYFTVTRPLGTASLLKEGNRAWLVVYVPVNEVSRLVKDLNTKAVFAILVALIFAAVITYLFSARLSKPIKTLKEHAILIAGRDFKSRVDIRTGDEIESLAKAMNQIAGDLDEYDIAQKRLIQNISHELKTPVMSIMGYAEGLMDGVITDREKALGIIVDECQRLRRMIDEVLYLSKLETLENFFRFEPGSPNQLVMECREKMAVLTANANLELKLELMPDREITLDRDKILQALINLISNAIRYARHEIVITTSGDENSVHITVEDDGEGIGEQELPHIFERFYKGKKGNVGLGMAIVKAIAEGHGGTVTAGSGRYGGALFEMNLPGK